MHDAKGRPLKVGDTVYIPAKVIQLTESTEDYCNVGVQTLLGRRPDDAKENFTAINTGVLLRNNEGDTNDLAEHRAEPPAPPAAEPPADGQAAS